MDLRSPLTQQVRPDVFKPKVVGLYEELLHDEHFDHSDGFWQSLFLLRPDQQALKGLLLEIDANELLRGHLPTQDLFTQATEYVRRGEPPTDENALDTLTVFLENILSKRYPNPSSDTITVLAGLEDADATLSGFASTLEATIKDGRTLDIRRKAVRTVIAAVAGGYQTSLVSYFVNQDLFPVLMELVQDADELFRVFAPCALLGLLLNYNKFEFRNPYQTRIEDFTDQATLRKVGNGMSHTLADARDAYIQIQDDVNDSWDFNSTLNWVGLGRLSKSTKVTPTATLSEDDIRLALATQPIPEAAILLCTYDFVNANQVFCLMLTSPTIDQPKGPAPVDELVSFSSYVLQNAYRSSRAAVYSQIMLRILRILIEDVAAAHCLCNGEMLIQIRLCRQRQPFLPTVRTDRTRIAVILDLLADGINHNLKRRLDADLYVLMLEPMLRAFSYLTKARAKIIYHWSELWKSLIGLLRFLTTYAKDLTMQGGIEKLADQLVSVLALALTSGESFLPDERSYDDLFYKILESAELLASFRDTYDVSKRDMGANMELLINVSTHYKALLEEKKGTGIKHLGTREITKLIKEGFETLSLQTKEGLDQWVKYRESEHRNLIKKVTRIAVQDLKTLLAERNP